MSIFYSAIHGSRCRFSPLRIPARESLDFSWKNSLFTLVKESTSQPELWGKQFPVEWEKKRPIYHYPDEPMEVVGDILEIGPGRGDMLLWLAGQHPEKRFVAIELMLSRYRKLIRRIERLGLTNIRLVRGNARIALPLCFKSPCFERVYVLFPDPWPKERHAYLRLLSVEFLNLLGTVMREGGELIFATDHKPLAEWVTRNLAQAPSLVNLGDPFSSDHTLIPNPDRTYFENKWRRAGKEIVFVHAQKRGPS